MSSVVARADSPVTLWRNLYRATVVACARQQVDVDLLGRIFQYARVCREHGDERVRVAVASELYERLFDDRASRAQLQRHLSETDFVELEPALSARLPPDELTTVRADFYAALAEVEAGTTRGTLRSIKDEILEACPRESQSSVQAAWAAVLSLLEVGESLVGLEMLLDNLSETGVPIDTALDARLRELLTQLRDRR